MSLQALTCPSCGGAIKIYSEETVSIGCPSCGNIYDVTSKTGKLVLAYEQAIKKIPIPTLPLGSSGTLLSERVTVIGCCIRKVKVDGVVYRWREYLLSAGENGFRWLTEYDGHWNFVRPITDLPKRKQFSEPPVLTHRNLEYRHFQTADAEVEIVLGEFYWKVRVGDKAECADYVSPPYMLSSEKTDGEITWSLGLYVEQEKVYAAFNLKKPMLYQTRVFANQVNPSAASLPFYRTCALVLGLGSFVLFGLLSAFCQNKVVHTQSFDYSVQDIEKSRITDSFELDGRTSNAEIEINTDLDNHWAFFGMALINEDTDVALDFGKEVDFYSGHDSDGYWSEGNKKGSIIIPNLPAGHYSLRLEPESDATALKYVVNIRRDVPRPAYFFLVLGLILLPWLWMETASYMFEVSRWSESDHPMVEESEEDDDD